MRVYIGVPDCAFGMQVVVYLTHEQVPIWNFWKVKHLLDLFANYDVRCEMRVVCARVPVITGLNRVSVKLEVSWPGHPVCFYMN